MLEITNKLQRPSFMTEEAYRAALRFLDRLRKIDRELVLYESGEKKFTLDVGFDEEIGKWTITTGYCSLGGCSSYVEFEDERTAKLEAMFLAEEDVQPTSDRACSSCYAEYMRDAY